MGKKILAGVLGGLAFFAWSSIAHMALGLGNVGLRDLPNEDAAMASLHNSITEPGLYFFPGLHLSPNATFAQKNAAMEAAAKKAESGPSGLMVFHPSGERGMTPGRLLTELATNIIQVLIAVLLLGYTSLASFAARWRFITLAGIMAAISTNISYWNWYGFPGNYTLAYICTVAMGFVCAGLVAAAIVKPGTSRSMAAVA